MAISKIPGAGVSADTLEAGDIAANAIGASELADNAVDTAAIADDAVGTAELANDVAISTSGAIAGTGGLTMDGATIFNETSADVDFRIESNNEANMFFVDGGTDKVGIGTNAVAAGQGKLTVYGNMQVTRGSAFGTLTTSAWAME